MTPALLTFQYHFSAMVMFILIWSLDVNFLPAGWITLLQAKTMHQDSLVIILPTLCEHHVYTHMLVFRSEIPQGSIYGTVIILYCLCILKTWHCYSCLRTSEIQVLFRDVVDVRSLQSLLKRSWTESRFLKMKFQLYCKSQLRYHVYKCKVF